MKNILPLVSPLHWKDEGKLERERRRRWRPSCLASSAPTCAMNKFYGKAAFHWISLAFAVMFWFRCWDIRILIKNHNLQAHNVVRIFTPSNKANKYHPPRASNWMADLKSGQIQNKGPLCGHICCCVLQIQVRMHSVSVNTKENLTFEQTPPSLISLWLSTVWQRKKTKPNFKDGRAVAKPWQLLQHWRLCGHICGGTIQHELHQEAAMVSSTFSLLHDPPLPTSISILCW